MLKNISYDLVSSTYQLNCPISLEMMKLIVSSEKDLIQSKNVNKDQKQFYNSVYFNFTTEINENKSVQFIYFPKGIIKITGKPVLLCTAINKVSNIISKYIRPHNPGIWKFIANNYRTHIALDIMEKYSQVRFENEKLLMVRTYFTIDINLLEDITKFMGICRSEQLVKECKYNPIGNSIIINFDSNSKTRSTSKVIIFPSSRKCLLFTNNYETFDLVKTILSRILEKVSFSSELKVTILSKVLEKDIIRI